MKKILLLANIFMMCCAGVSAQMYVYKGGEVTHTLPVDVDSMTFERSEVAVEGALPGEFSVSAEGETVVFSCGNLQYNAVEGGGIWRFAANQYDVIGEGNANIAEDYDGWIDLFGWGTSGYNDCLPTMATGYNSNADYGPAGNENITGENENYDWGVYNAISNGGNKAGLWRTLTLEELEYIFSGRENAEQLRALGDVAVSERETVKGVIFLPDNWVLPEGLTFTPWEMGKPGENVYTLEQWKQMEEAGALFLPAAGTRSEKSVMSVGMLASYWTASATSDVAAYVMMAATNGMISVGGGAMAPSQSRFTGLPVRLVRKPGSVETGKMLVHKGGDVILEEDVEAVDSLTFGDAVYRGEFSVSAERKVRFSRGNLQYHPVDDVWRFAERQFDAIGEDNKNIAPDYDGWIDLFGWGTSGCDERCLPTEVSASQTESVYGPEGEPGYDDVNSLVGEYANYDWGVYNAISNGGNKAGLWRTLTQTE